jgi:SAM-dependent methyltransferase
MMSAPDLQTFTPATSSDEIADFVWDRGTAYRGDTVERRAREELLEFIHANPGEVVFDAGCGTAVNALMLAGQVGRVVGMDSDEMAVARARIRIEKAGISNVSVMKGDISTVPLADQSVDRVLCLSVIQYFDDEGVRRVLREFRRLLRPGGELVLHVKNSGSLYAMTLSAAKRLLRRRKPGRYQLRRFGWYVRELEAAGFELRDYNSFNLLMVERMPHWLFAFLNAVEVTQRRRFPFSTGFLRRRGLDLKLRAKLVAR